MCWCMRCYGGWVMKMLSLWPAHHLPFTSLSTTVYQPIVYRKYHLPADHIPLIGHVSYGCHAFTWTAKAGHCRIPTLPTMSTLHSQKLPGMQK
eukprot:jgi/Mesvir1/28712/Mv25846-RA.1